MGDDGVEHLRPHDGGLGRVVLLREQRVQLRLSDEERIGLVVGPVDGHAEVVEEGGQGDDDLGVVHGEPVVLHDPGLHAGLHQEPEQSDGDVGDDLHVDGPVVGHPEAVDGRDVGGGPEGVELVIGVDAIQDPVQAIVVPGRHPDLHAARHAIGQRAGELVVRGRGEPVRHVHSGPLPAPSRDPVAHGWPPSSSTSRSTVSRTTAGSSWRTVT